ncbi:hypothetical protein WA026_001158 [Henosepilachna vigintioctopunctata]|uniref:Uncharacterized protein n=1 Tax=Henosepilachna vigintioctopunctata TaxID=420089 RepID=A0AAW1V755_9CUCU
MICKKYCVLFSAFLCIITPVTSLTCYRSDDFNEESSNTLQECESQRMCIRYVELKHGEKVEDRIGCGDEKNCTEIEEEKVSNNSTVSVYCLKCDNDKCVPQLPKDIQNITIKETETNIATELPLSSEAGHVSISNKGEVGIVDDQDNSPETTYISSENPLKTSPMTMNFFKKSALEMKSSSPSSRTRVHVLIPLIVLNRLIKFLS